jgi:hypothetical protein
MMRLAVFGAVIIGMALAAVILALYLPPVIAETKTENVFIIIGLIGSVSGAIMVSIKQIRDAIYLARSKVEYGFRKSNQSWNDVYFEHIVQMIGLGLSVLSAVFLGIIALR